jgi:hypothetical protein
MLLDRRTLVESREPDDRCSILFYFNLTKDLPQQYFDNKKISYLKI